eukprot:jgi/Chlat1/1435/Chrsp12S00103
MEAQASDAAGTSSESAPLFIGVDCGTGSVRAVVVNANGAVQSACSVPIRTWNERCGGNECYEQSGEDIWGAACAATRRAIADAGADRAAARVRGIGFCATCSLVQLDSSGAPATVSLSRDAERNVVLWFCHRAESQARRINDMLSGSEPLRHIGGEVHPENEVPKIWWLSENGLLQHDGQLMDLADFLVYKAVGAGEQSTRSSCCLACKWMYDAHAMQWPEEVWKGIGLEDLLGRSGVLPPASSVLEPGRHAGVLSAEARAAMGLEASPSSVAVSAGMIDAHCGGVGVLGGGDGEEAVDLEKRVAVIAGSSTCVMVSTREKVFAPGVWGPFYKSMAPGLWLLEGGDSATGVLLDYVLKSHPASRELIDRAGRAGKDVHRYLVDDVIGDDPRRQGWGLTVVPYHHGSRLFGPAMRGTIIGLELESNPDSVDNLARLYAAHVHALALSIRAILETVARAVAGKGERESVDITAYTLCICGGLVSNKLFVRALADACGCPVRLPRTDDAVAVGAAILGAAAANGDNIESNLRAAMDAMSAGGGGVIEPDDDPEVRQAWDAKYHVFMQLVDVMRDR